MNHDLNPHTYRKHIEAYRKPQLSSTTTYQSMEYGFETSIPKDVSLFRELYNRHTEKPFKLHQTMKKNRLEIQDVYRNGGSNLRNVSSTHWSEIKA
jgi:hypothetical protein